MQIANKNICIPVGSDVSMACIVDNQTHKVKGIKLINKLGNKKVKQRL